MRYKDNVIAILSLIIIALLFYIYINETNDKDLDKNIFYNNIESVVEVKAEVGNQESYGTAVFIDKTGNLITNAHVVTLTKNGKKIAYDDIYIRFAKDDNYLPVKLIAFDEENDLALLIFESELCDFKAIELGDSDEIEFGDTVYAIGNSMNTGLAISKGIIGNPDIFIDYDGKTRECIQADLTISSGNSGGPLLDENGKLIGITTFRLKDNEGNIVYGNCYSIPLDCIEKFLKENT